MESVVGIVAFFWSQEYDIGTAIQIAACASAAAQNIKSGRARIASM